MFEGEGISDVGLNSLQRKTAEKTIPSTTVISLLGVVFDNNRKNPTFVNIVLADAKYN